MLPFFKTLTSITGKKRVIALLLVAVLLVSLPAAIVAAKEKTTHTINCNFVGTYTTWDYYGGPSSIEEGVNASFNGTLKEKNGDWYLLPLSGNITIADETYEIVVTDVNHPRPRPISYSEKFFGNQKTQNAYCCLEVNINGYRYAGYLRFYGWSEKVGDKWVQIPEWGQQELFFQGIVDGEIAYYITGTMTGTWPEIE